MNAPAVIRAIDIGYGTTKFVIDDHRSCRAFPSVAAPARAQRARSGLLRERRTSQVWIDGHAYEVGPDAALFLSTVPVLHRDYVETPEYQALLYGALDAMQIARLDLLVTGLPVHLHASRWKRLREKLIGVHAISPGREIEVREAAVVIQPVGGFVAHNHERGEWASAADRTYLLIDPGYFTFDWMVTRGLAEVPGLSGSVECSVSEFLKCIAESLSAALGDHYTNLRAIDEGLQTGRFRINGRPFDLTPHRAAAQEILSQAIRALLNNVASAMREVDEIVLVGGGAQYFRPVIQKTFPEHPVFVVNDPVTANVRGFQLIGETYMRRRAATA
jgi:plasmid segregation protein ParM